MRVVYLGAANSVHSQKWVLSLAQRGIEIHLVTQHALPEEIRESLKSHVKIHLLPYSGHKGYFLNLFALKKLLKKINPDLMHSNYASGYGTLAALTGFHPHILSVWGDDVYQFPYRGRMRSFLLRFNLASADAIASTSKGMATQTKKFSPPSIPIEITPFGVDMKLFYKKHRKNSRPFTIGTVKSIDLNYGTDWLLQSFAKFLECIPENEKSPEAFRLLLVGGGPHLQQIIKMGTELQIQKFIEYRDYIANELVPDALSEMDIFANLSRYESFGVAAVEASACEVPVIATDVGGLPEIIVHGENGYLVARGDTEKAAEFFLRIYEKRDQLNPRNVVFGRFSKDICVEKMLELYSKYAKSSKNR